VCVGNKWRQCTVHFPLNQWEDSEINLTTPGRTSVPKTIDLVCNLLFSFNFWMVYMVSMLLFFNVQYVIINFDKKGSKINDLGWFNLKK
jgi:hypothetical protein